MAHKSAYNLPLATLGQGEFERQWTVGQELFSGCQGSAEDIRDADVQVTLQIEHKGDIYHLLFTLSGVVTVSCDRCLDDLTLPVDSEYAIDMRYGEEHDESNERVTILSAGETSIDVGPIIRDTIMLSLPLRKVHAPGECNAEIERYITAEPEEETED